MTDLPTTAERYATAIETSNMRVAEGRCPADIIIAAGWARSGIGMLLLRLRGEWDDVKRVHEQAVAALNVGEKSAARLRAQDKPEDADAAIKAATDAAVTARAMILVEISTLYATKQALGARALDMAHRGRHEIPEADVLRLAGRCLDVWLDPNCPACSGRGYSGGGRHEHATAPVVCKPCGGTGKRSTAVGRDDNERRFARAMLCHMDEAITSAEIQMRECLA